MPNDSAALPEPCVSRLTRVKMQLCLNRDSAHILRSLSLSLSSATAVYAHKTKRVESIAHVGWQGVYQLLRRLAIWSARCKCGQHWHDALVHLKVAAVFSAWLFSCNAPKRCPSRAFYWPYRAVDGVVCQGWAQQKEHKRIDVRRESRVAQNSSEQVGRRQ